MIFIINGANKYSINFQATVVKDYSMSSDLGYVVDFMINVCILEKIFSWISVIPFPLR